MTQVHVKGFKIFKDRHGNMRCYHRATGHKIDLDKSPIGSAEFFAECETIRAIAEAQKARAPKVGTLGALVQNYFETEHYQNLAKITRGNSTAMITTTTTPPTRWNTSKAMPMGSIRGAWQKLRNLKPPTL
jgi:hypothetical protein